MSMFTRQTYPGGIVAYHSSLLTQLGVPHAFSTRHGGISTGPLASLNLGNPLPPAPQDLPEVIEINYQRLTEALQFGPRTRVWVKQVHGNEVVLCEADEDLPVSFSDMLAHHWTGQQSADGLVTQRPDLILTVRTADCVPVLLASSDGRTVAALHAGWRGLVAGVLGRGVRAMAEYGHRPADLRAAIGPCIGPVAYEVDTTTAGYFSQLNLTPAIHTDLGPKPHLDLALAADLQLRALGLTQTDRADLCTASNPADFYSHRHTAGTTGRLAALIATK
jgi:YfiH family protein